ncbi:MAG: LysR family transcriptional regulator [Alphaproteobacteria bacterium]|nr:LysR family transcriptional regulator [Alphaproteobacteria bacterium]MCB9796071.1 LysR family transcriptional regulator [Alphaproteobacteria bacterium]
MSSLPSLNALQAFEAVARLGSFAAAAGELGVSPSAVSHRVRGLEEELGVPLLERSTRHVALSLAGGQLLPSVVQGLAQLEEGLRALRAPSGALTVSCSPSLAIRWLVPRLHRFAELEPEIDVRVSAADALVEPGRAGVDVCLRYGAGGYVGVEALQLTDEEVFPVCSPRLSGELRAPADLLGQRLLEGEALPGHPGRVGWSDWLAAAGLKGGGRQVRYSHASLALEAAIAGQGVALGRSTLVADALDQGLLARPFALGLPSGLSYWFLTSQGPQRPALRAFRRWVISELARS